MLLNLSKGTLQSLEVSEVLIVVEDDDHRLTIRSSVQLEYKT